MIRSLSLLKRCNTSIVMPSSSTYIRFNATRSTLQLFGSTQQQQQIQYRNYSSTVEPAKVPKQLIMDLRSRTSAPISDCKKALEASSNDIEKAVQWLLEKGKATASKLSNRVVVEGVISVLVDNNKAVILEMNSETDFVSRGDTFRQLAKSITSQIVGNSSTDLLGKTIAALDMDRVSKLPCESTTVSDAIVQTVAKLRENIQLRRAAGIGASKPNTIVSGYAHDPSGTRQFGRLGSIIEIEYDGQPSDMAAVKQLADDLAVHIVGVGPSYVSIESVPKEVLEEAVKNKRHPNSLYDEVVLLEQKFISGQDGETVKEAIERVSKGLNTNVKVNSFARYVVGEGMEKKQENYHAEVMEKINAAKQ
ncbi:hypothetical protein SAMD00019534_034260 [Acytostelium subglobosum LB1]|uniref:hypothetical protein n=1 Tax=Acytostelium subglobosum LB1 TaxID=1410327 RepID=UPI000644F589|nr:hypothetical protein SAMD00019534_034260 [Acytostelium subglobosum LB1]GAM20251.1 hypothetical protein SAMD00019534_034260 [Acytostelium subglobosum LB1]|eukprot:XP_012759772.1 hypothetical protein SAMD00019534_034260 [Acytostelium subglobosum LB1]